VKVEVVFKDVGARKNGAKAWATREYSPTRPRVKLCNKRLWVGGSCWGKGMEFKLAEKAWAHKKNSFCKFSQLHVEKHLSQIHISLLLVALPWGKTKHHWGSRKSKCQVATLYKSCVSLSNGKPNVTCTSCRRMVQMRLYRQGQ